MLPKPSLFVIGAPRTGTTALCAHLQRHPQIFFSEPKEPCFWANDFPALRDHVGCTNLVNYQRLFRMRLDRGVLGEGSTVYLASELAIPKILEFNAAAKFIVLLRNPVELAYSFYSQQRFTLNEDRKSFAEAWALQSPRQRGEAIPKHCVEPALLQYRKIASIGTQLQRAMQLIPPRQLLVLFQEEMREHARTVYQRTLGFLSLPDDGRQRIERLNAASSYRSDLVGQALETKMARKLLNSTKRVLPDAVFHRAQRLKSKLLIAAAHRPPLNDEFLDELYSVFSDEVALLAQLTGRDLDHWRPARVAEGSKKLS